jgi:hypothetical protein
MESKYSSTSGLENGVAVDVLLPKLCEALQRCKIVYINLIYISSETV